MAEGETPSPAGPLVADAEAEGYEGGKRQPYYGYYFRILKSQGPHAPGGEKNYVVDGKMTGGFAVLAYPVEYGSSGVMSFFVDSRGTVYQKDLGDATDETAKAMKAFDPDPVLDAAGELRVRARSDLERTAAVSAGTALRSRKKHKCPRVRIGPAEGSRACMNRRSR